ncbi:MAG: carboxypeptidase regulatory-like domain-containing protein, partial [Blastocatellia bacterium]|nr:carboxypeptidase regulatory-like domain-containing protein [Blastocatellia bacterium]
GSSRTATTDSAGRFAIAGLPVAGEYEITASMPGFAEARTNRLKLGAGTTASVVFQLEVAEAQAEITVSSVPGEVRTDSPQLGNRLDARLVQATPLINNRVTYLSLLNAANRQAINQGDVFMNQNLFTANGAGRRQTSFEVDGSTGNDSWGRQTMFSNLPAA